MTFPGRLALAGALTAALSGAQDPMPPQPIARSYRVLVTGEVRYPGRVILTASTMLLPDALAAVGSPTRNAGDEVVVIRATAPGTPPERITISLLAMDAGRPEAAIALLDDDIVNVPMTKRFIVSGFVLFPGPYKLEIGATVSRAIALAGGLSEGGSDRRIRIIRAVKGKATEISAQLTDLVLADDEIKITRRMF